MEMVKWRTLRQTKKKTAVKVNPEAAAAEGRGGTPRTTPLHHRCFLPCITRSTHQGAQATQVGRMFPRFTGRWPWHPGVPWVPSACTPHLSARGRGSCLRHSPGSHCQDHFPCWVVKKLEDLGPLLQPIHIKVTMLFCAFFLFQLRIWVVSVRVLGIFIYVCNLVSSVCVGLSVYVRFPLRKGK